MDFVNHFSSQGLNYMLCKCGYHFFDRLASVLA